MLKLRTRIQQCQLTFIIKKIHPILIIMIITMMIKGQQVNKQKQSPDRVP